MPMSQSLLAEMDHEMAGTRRVLERVDESQLAWRPHEKSMTLGRLASHLAELPKWVRMVIEQDSLALDGNYQPLTLGSRQEMLDLFDGNVVEGRRLLGGASDETLMRPWRLLSKGNEVLNLPKIGVLRTMVMNHTIHHRGQLTVYLRMTGSPVPGLYGPSADEPRM